MSIWQDRKTKNRGSKSTTSTFEPVPYKAEPCTQCDSVKTCLNNEFRNFDRSILKRVSTIVYDSPPPLHVINAEKRILRQERVRSAWKKGKSLSQSSLHDKSVGGPESEVGTDGSLSIKDE
ncbi:hypothetical protein HOLleu_31109 [Holothuria leucospilota]|uniref:Uncharacterized protein n=1 Tax=Holothuria leucospilota TaxID=206669 RepID=A0A9Q1BLP6_HOLLE|nr:hypothetical protein HOLleu_31109 [Holothuria leucospilota]